MYNQAMNKFFRELASGEIHIRDKWQFELKSEFFPLKGGAQNVYTQEFYFFIPNSLQINEENYSKSNFYNDQTNFIRYKTPIFTFTSLIDPTNSLSPLARLRCLKGQEGYVDELKLLGNIVRSALRRQTHAIVEMLEASPFDKSAVEKAVALLCDNLRCLHSEFTVLMEPDDSYYLYTNQFLRSTICHYLTGLLTKIRSSHHDLAATDTLICQLLVEEQEAPTNGGEPTMYRQGLLNKFILDALLLVTNRSSPDKRFKNIIGSFAAGIAMFIYLMFFIWQGQMFLINSEPFILATVVLYILKDRLKEGLRALSFRQALKWFSDYTTEILSPDGTTQLGKLKESFSFLNSDTLPQEIIEMRNKEFHSILEEFPRPETIIYHKKRVEMYPLATRQRARRHGLNMIYRFTIFRFLNKADNATTSYLTIDPSNFHFLRQTLPKVYHVNIILRNRYTKADGTTQVELKKFRLILDKNGIKRIEHPTTP